MIKKIGILGAGQLARMLSLAASPLGMTTLCFDPKASTSARAVTEVITADYEDEGQLQKFAEQVDVITYETENIPLKTVQFLNQHKALFPSSQTLAGAQDRLQEKTLFQSLGIPSAGFRAIDSLEALHQGTEDLGFPCVLKTRRLGYDGKGQRVLRSAHDSVEAWEALGTAPLLLEEFIAFEKEVSLIAVQGVSDTRFYALTKNEHHNGILHASFAPYVENELQQMAESYAKKLLAYFDYRGVLAIEFFCLGGRLIANEIAPRVHNSGHWTIEGACTSQFENHMRAIAGLPLGSTQTRGYSAMFNCLGREPELAAILSVSNAHYHHYAKSPAPGRKVAHVTLSAPDPVSYEQGIAELKSWIVHSSS